MLLLRERTLLGELDRLSDAELLALVLGTGSAGERVTELANDLLEAAGGLEGLARLAPHGITQRRGLGPAKASRVTAALELGRRATLGGLTLRSTVLSSFDDVARWARPRLAGLDHEEVWLLGLDGRNALKAARRIAQGGQHGCALGTRDVLGPALRDAVSGIVLVHNHPSGDPRPSVEDVGMTRELARACHFVGVPLIDHVVVARGGASSLLEAGALEFAR
ncbi:MAG TPA: DNA repair protein RadC [Polyangiaceae bacterium]|jgi:DNA repair protein RadC|nr:DNA repair protein RadC [Polyangiaceae bacterium]